MFSRLDSGRNPARPEALLLNIEYGFQPTGHERSVTLAYTGRILSDSHQKVPVLHSYGRGADTETL